MLTYAIENSANALNVTTRLLQEKDLLKSEFVQWKFETYSHTIHITSNDSYSVWLALCQMEQVNLWTYEAVVNIPPPPIPEIWRGDKLNLDQPIRIRRLTNREIISISMLFDKPQASMPIEANKTAEWFAPCLPMTSQRRPYRGVNVHVARR